MQSSCVCVCACARAYVCLCVFLICQPRADSGAEKSLFTYFLSKVYSLPFIVLGLSWRLKS